MGTTGQCCVEVELRQEAADKDVDAGGGVGVGQIDGKGIDWSGGVFGGNFSGRQAGDRDRLEAGEFERLGGIEEMAIHRFALGNADCA